MWKLKPEESGGEIFFLVSDKKYVVGRKNCEILLSNDQSISREHANLTVTDQGVSLKDSSKYGTFVNDEKLDTGSTKTLQTGDRVTFGVFQSKFRLEKESIVVCSSCVDNEGKVALSQDVRSIGGQMVNSWTLECTHLVMPTVKITIKTICALLCCRPIVKPEFFSVFSKAVEKKLPLPKPERFRPQIDEPTLTKEDLDLSARPERKSLFKGKTFVFLNSKQMKRLSQAVSFGGAVSQLLEEGSLPVSLLVSSNTCVIDMISGNSQVLIPPSTKKWVESVAKILHRKGLRLITESEVGLAAIHISNQTYCNPCSSIHSEPVKGKPVIALDTFSQNTAVDETALVAPSQNITAYVVNTEVSPDPIRIDTSGISAVGETPEKTHPAQRSLQPSTFPKTRKPSLDPERSASHKETVMSPEGYSGVEPERKLKTGSSGKGLDCSMKSITAASGSTKLKQSPQKQSALTHFFQPASKKRPRQDSLSSVQSEAKISRKDIDGKVDEMINSGPSYSQHSSSNSITNKISSTGQNQRYSSSSLGFGSDHTVAQPGKSCGSTQSSGGKKRKEPVLDVPPGQDEAADFDLSLEELESIMSEEMDEPLQTAANKKQCLESDLSTANNPQCPYQQKIKTNQQSSTNNIQQLDRKGPISTNYGSEKQSKRSSNQVLNSEREAHRSANGEERLEEDLKEEEVSFVVTSRTQKDISQPFKAGAKQEMQTSVSPSGTKNDPELPRRLVQIQFQSLTVSNSSRTTPIPLQTRDPNGKNVKKFCKTSVPGLKGLPNIIGGSDLVAHNRSKSSELEEWLRQAAEEEKQNEREETLGDDLFRYNPKPCRKMK